MHRAPSDSYRSLGRRIRGVLPPSCSQSKMCSVGSFNEVMDPPEAPRIQAIEDEALTAAAVESNSTIKFTPKERKRKQHSSVPAASPVRKKKHREKFYVHELQLNHQADPFRCPICLDTLSVTSIVECERCANVFCQKCVDSAMRRKPECPVCRHRPVSVMRRNRPLERLVGSFIIPCIHSECDKHVSRAELSGHLAERCEYEKIRCKRCGSGDKVFRKDLEQKGHGPGLCKPIILPSISRRSYKA